MTAVVPRPTRPDPVRRSPRGSAFLGHLNTTDPKTLGIMHIVTALGFFLAGGGLVVDEGRAGPTRDDFLTPEQYNQLFTLRGTIMRLLYATPIGQREHRPVPRRTRRRTLVRTGNAPDAPSSRVAAGPGHALTPICARPVPCVHRAPPFPALIADPELDLNRRNADALLGFGGSAMATPRHGPARSVPHL